MSDPKQSVTDDDSESQYKVVVNAAPKDALISTMEPASKTRPRGQIPDDYLRCDSDVSDDELESLPMNLMPGDVDELDMNTIDVDTDVVDLTNLRLSDCGDLSSFTKCEMLSLRHNRITNDVLYRLQGIKNTVTEIDLYENHLTPLPEDAFSGLNVLESLDVSFNEIRFTRGFHGLPKLRELYLIQNKITKVGDLAHLAPTLEMLELGSNRIRVIENMEPLVNLTSLYFGRNKIVNINGLSSLKKLDILSLQSNRIVKIENLSGLESLRELYLSHNGIKNIENLDNLTKLELIDLSGNFITKVENLENLVNLKDVWLNNNLIDSYDFLEVLKKLPKLETLYIEQNPITMERDYVDKIRQALPNLIQIDANYF